MTALPSFYLASHSPRRRQLLEQLGLSFEVLPVIVDETPYANEPPSDYVRRIAQAKAHQAWRDLSLSVRRPVLAADTAVVAEQRILGKPRNRDEGLEMLGLLSGREHEVFTGLALMAEQPGVRVNHSRVRFRSLTAAECAAYWDTGEPRDKAGAYAIQGIAAIFIESLTGSYSAVMGLPLYEAAALLATAGITVL